MGQTGSGHALHLTQLVCESYDVPPGGDVALGIFRPISVRAAQDEFGVAEENLYRVYAQWANPNDEPFPVSTNDLLIPPTGQEYVVRGVKIYANLAIVLLVGIEHPGGR